jgi:predicted TPR repeat methyltransferase
VNAGKRPDWRAALARFDPASARLPVTLFGPQRLLARGLSAEAVEAYRDFLVRFPNDVKAMHGLGALLRRIGRPAEAEAVFAEAARVEARNFGAAAAVQQFLAAADGVGAPPDKTPAAIVTKLYDDSAGEFESRLCGHLNYRGPAILRDALIRAGFELHDLRVVDLGCGTGLAGVAFRPFAKHLVGVDLSAGMLAEAAKKGVYDELAQGEVVEFLRSRPASADLILAADVFVYLGDLLPVLNAAREALVGCGVIAFTVESGHENGDEYRLQGVRRYLHPERYLLRAAAESGLHVQLLEKCSTRTESTFPVASFAVVLENVTPPRRDTTSA